MSAAGLVWQLGKRQETQTAQAVAQKKEKTAADDAIALKRSQRNSDC